MIKFKGSVEINASREKVAAYFIDPAYLGEYQDGFVRKELLQGQEATDGAVSKMYYHFNGRDMVLTETIVANHLPHSFEAFYHHKHMDNTMKATFTPTDRNRTRYTYEFEYTRINWIMPRLSAILFPNVYRKQGEKWMWQFKEFVERQEA